MRHEDRRIVYGWLAGVLVFFLLEQGALNGLPAATRALPIAVCKGLATLCATLLCFVGTRRTGQRADRLLAAALLVCVLADVLINILPLPGILLFMGAHGLFCAAYLRMTRIRARTVYLFAGLVAATWTALLCFRDAAGQLLLPSMAYAAVISFMVALAADLAGTLRIGAILFALSDLLLALNVLLEATPLSRFVSLAVYYIALGLIAVSPWMGRAAKRHCPAKPRASGTHPCG